MEDSKYLPDDELRALRNELVAKPFLTDDVERVEEAVLRRHQALLDVKDPKKPWRGENRAPVRALVVAGNFRAGKSRAVREAIARMKELTLPDASTLPLRPLLVNAPEHFTIEGLGRTMLDEMKLLPARALGPSRTIERLHTRIGIKHPTIIHIDEAQRMLTPDRVAQHRRLEEQVKIFGQLRALIDFSKWPCVLVLSGTPDLVRALEGEQFGFFREVTDFIPITQMTIGNEQDRQDLEDALGVAAEKVGMAVDVAGCEDFFDRLILAANRARGLAFDICHEAILLAARERRKTVNVEDFAAFYARKAGCYRAANPFVASDWHRIDPKTLLAAMAGEMATKVWGTK
ncbi:AAA family ATPase [Devosia sp. LjRoot16]|uniref:AAA family ATPase n=1 Tax=Devosia sp. LjRoot16 TaxID=3342271 RepID=UPI003ECC3A2A